MHKKSGTGPVRINTLFLVYKERLRAPERSVIEVAIVVIEEVCGISIPATQLRYSPHSRTLVCKAPGPQKSEIRMHQEEILTHIRGRLGASSAPQHLV